MGIEEQLGEIVIRPNVYLKKSLQSLQPKLMVSTLFQTNQYLTPFQNFHSAVASI